MDSSGRSGEKWPRRGPYRCGGCGMMPKKTACICIKSATTAAGMSSSSSPPADHSSGSGPYGQGGSGGYRMPRSMATTPRAQAALANKMGAAGVSGGGGSGGMMMAGPSGLGLRLDTQALSASQQREPASLGYGDLSTTSGGGVVGGGARATRCGHCRTCVNPRLKKACLTLRQASSAPPPPPMAGGEQAALDLGGSSSLLFSGGAGTRGGGGAMDPIASSRHLSLDLAGGAASASAPAPPSAHGRAQRTMRMPRSISAPSFADWQEEGLRSAHHSFMVPEPRLDHGFLPEPTKLASMPEDGEGSEGDWVSEFGDEEEEDAMRHLLGDGVVPLKRNLSGMKRMFGGMSKAESMPNLTAMVPDDLDDPFDYDDGLDLGLDAFGQSPPVPLATDLMDLDRESNLEPLGENLVGYFGMMGPSSVEGAGALGAGVLSASAGPHLAVSNTPMESTSLLMGESHPHAAACSPPRGSSSMSLHSASSRGASGASGSGSGGGSHPHNPFAALASSSGRGSGADSRLMEALDAARPPERSSSMPYSHSRERSQSHDVTHSLSVERRGKHQNIRQQPTDHLSAKRVSRIMANRLSAAKSRVKKLQHTADLEGRVKELQGHIDQLRPQVMSLQQEHTTLMEQTQALRAKLQHAQQLKCQQEKRMADMTEEIRQLSSLQGGEYGGVMCEGGEGAQRTDVSCGGMLQGGTQDNGKMPMIA